MAPFRFNAIKVLLTYPNCPDVEQQQLFDFLNTLGSGDISYSICCRELHQDGTPHFHAFILWKKKQNWKDAERMFDYLGHHPNIVSDVRAMDKCIAYVKKDGDILEHGVEPSEFNYFFDLSLSR